ncbi:efflux RND transporter periplasmic adaptor subunit [Pararhodobacter zhoushanensis]|uniref:Efflux RND transporter periplasmic adaptor subunit n=1 Tax=Pararhodobacter zhoushanensis TaxID=2479545 RepID=A0ABT3H232_9RHOB|nr:efflux RND transporter periplasmic adaptor subunit [Pararhodobacter zhoushanensis]MCW1933831.1 efflux RND transporter periplasmic adaptor subunit [Pararhodobacter zhoushanensis]
MARRSVTLFLIIGLMVGALVFVRLAQHPQEAVAQDMGSASTVLLTVATAQPEQITLETEYAGRVAAFRRVEIRPQIGGVILERLVDAGSLVSAGDVLFRIDPAPFNADLGTAQAALARAEAAEAFAQRALERSDALLARNAVSIERNDSAHNDLLLARASLAEAQAAVARKRLDLEFTTLRSPIDGYVAAGITDLGGLAAQGSDRPLAIIQDLETVFVDVRLPADALDAILAASEAGLGPVRITTARHDGPVLEGRVRSSDLIVDPGTGDVSVRVETPNPGLDLLPGMLVRAHLPRGVLPDALLVPEEAVLRSGGGAAQLVLVSPQGEATRSDVSLGDRVGNRIVVTSGLRPGDIVAVRGQDRVQTGAAVPVTTIAAGDQPAAVNP